jgi:hypothetical protein
MACTACNAQHFPRTDPAVITEKPGRNLASPETLARAPGKGEGLQRDFLGVTHIGQETDKVTTEAGIPFLEETAPSRLIGTSGQNLGLALAHRE